MIFTPGRVYFLKERDYLNGDISPYVKIGIVRNEKESDKRIKEHQTGNPREIYNYRDVEAPFVEKLETQLHYLFAEKWITGEWFLLNDAELESVIDKAKLLAQEQKNLETVFKQAESLKSIVSNGQLIKATESVLTLQTEYNIRKEQLDGLRAKEEIISRKLKQILGQHAEITGVANWQANKDIEKFDEDAFKEAHAELYTQYCKEKENFKQTFLVKGKQSLSKSNPELHEEKQAIENPGNILSKDIHDSKLEPNDDIKSMHQAFIDLQPKIASITWEIDQLEAQLKSAIGENDEIEGLVTWKRNHDMKVSFDKSSFKQDHEAIYLQYTSTAPGTASFKLNKWRPYRV